jgi:hypothetical protein
MKRMAFAEAGGMVLLVASVMMLISSGCMSQAQYEARMAEIRTHYASSNIIDANELEEFVIGCPPPTKNTQGTNYKIIAFRPAPQGQVLYVLRSKVINTYTGAYSYWAVTTELNALDVNSGNWLWPSWIPVGGRYDDSAIAPDGKSMVLITQQNSGNYWPGLCAFLSVINLEIQGRQVTSDIEKIKLGWGEQLSLVFYSGVSYYNYSCIRFSPDGKYLAVLGSNPDYKPFHSDSLMLICIYQLPLSDYDNDAKKPVTIPVDGYVGENRYESDPNVPSRLHRFRFDLGKTYHGVFDTETGKEIESMHLRKDLCNARDICVVGNRILVVHGKDLTIFKPGDLTEVDTQCPLVAAGDIVSKTDRFIAIGPSNFDKGRPYILSIFDAKNLNKPPSEVRILGLNPFEEGFQTLTPPIAIVGNYLIVPRVRYYAQSLFDTLDLRSPECDACTILRYDLRKIPSLWTQDEETK